jgi:hypothetical protein
VLPSIFTYSRAFRIARIFHDARNDINWELHRGIRTCVSQVFFFFFTVPIVILNNAHNNSSTPILYHPCYLHTSPFAVSDKICMQTYTEPHIGKAARD